MINIKRSNFYKDKPIFGLDIGPSSLKVMQLDRFNSKPEVVGYGYTQFKSEAIVNGVVKQPKIIAEAAKKLFNELLVGDITTNRVALAIPAYRTFTRTLSLPKLKLSEIKEATELEAEQYITSPLDSLYLDYTVTHSGNDSTEVFFVGVSKEIVHSFIELTQILGLETILIEPTLSSSARLFSIDNNSDVPTVIIDLGSRSADISIYRDRIIATGTVPAGGDLFTSAIADALKVSEPEAHLIKTKYGLGVSKRQKEITKAFDPILGQLTKELRRLIRYYEERYGTDKPIKHIVTLGGGANVPGLNDYLTNDLRLPVRSSDPWHYFDFKKLKAPSRADMPMFATVAGLSMIEPKDVFS